MKLKNIKLLNTKRIFWVKNKYIANIIIVMMFVKKLYNSISGILVVLIVI